MPARASFIPHGSRKPIEGLSARIEARAYEIYERRGRRIGRDLEDWLEAERETLKTA